MFDWPNVNQGTLDGEEEKEEELTIKTTPQLHKFLKTANFYDIKAYFDGILRQNPKSNLNPVGEMGFSSIHVIARRKDPQILDFFLNIITTQNPKVEINPGVKIGIGLKSDVLSILTHVPRRRNLRSRRASPLAQTPEAPYSKEAEIVFRARQLTKTLPEENSLFLTISRFIKNKYDFDYLSYGDLQILYEQKDSENDLIKNFVQLCNIHVAGVNKGALTKVSERMQQINFLFIKDPEFTTKFKDFSLGNTLGSHEIIVEFARNMLENSPQNAQAQLLDNQGVAKKNKNHPR